MGLTPLQPLHPLDQDQDVNQSVNSFKNTGMPKKGKQMNIMIHENNHATGQVPHQKLAKMPALPKQYQRERYEHIPAQQEADYD